MGRSPAGTKSSRGKQSNTVTTRPTSPDEPKRDMQQPRGRKRPLIVSSDMYAPLGRRIEQKWAEDTLAPAGTSSPTTPATTSTTSPQSQLQKSYTPPEMNSIYPPECFDPWVGFPGVYLPSTSNNAMSHFYRHVKEAKQFLENRGLLIDHISLVAYEIEEPTSTRDGGISIQTKIHVLVFCPVPMRWYQSALEQARKLFWPVGLYHFLVLVCGRWKDFHPRDGISGVWKMDEEGEKRRKKEVEEGQYLYLRGDESCFSPRRRREVPGEVDVRDLEGEYYTVYGRPVLDSFFGYNL